MTCGALMSVGGERGLQQGYFGLYGNTGACMWVQGHRIRRKWHVLEFKRIVMASFGIGEL